MIYHVSKNPINLQNKIDCLAVYWTRFYTKFCCPNTNLGPTFSIEHNTLFPRFTGGLWKFWQYFLTHAAPVPHCNFLAHISYNYWCSRTKCIAILVSRVHSAQNQIKSKQIGDYRKMSYKLFLIDNVFVFERVVKLHCTYLCHL